MLADGKPLITDDLGAMVVQVAGGHDGRRTIHDDMHRSGALNPAKGAVAVDLCPAALNSLLVRDVRAGGSQSVEDMAPTATVLALELHQRLETRGRGRRQCHHQNYPRRCSTPSSASDPTAYHTPGRSRVCSFIS